MHWTDWLQENPQFDYRNPANDLLLMGPQSGVDHFGIHCQVGDTVGQRGVMATQDSSGRIEKFPHVQQELVKIRYSAIGAAEAVHEFFFQLVDRELREDYQKVAKEASTLSIDFEIRRKNQIFSLTAVLVNLLRIEHKDASDWKSGIAALIPMGDYTGAELILRELGLQIKAPPGTVQIMRGCELRHSITKWRGVRVVIVSVAHDAIRRWAQREVELKSQAPSKKETMRTDSSYSEDLYPSKTKNRQADSTEFNDRTSSEKAMKRKDGSHSDDRTPSRRKTKHNGSSGSSDETLLKREPKQNGGSDSDDQTCSKRKHKKCWCISDSDSNSDDWSY
jgi:hypothetical protein